MTSYNLYIQLMVKVGKNYDKNNTLVSLIYTFVLAGNIIIHTPTHSTKKQTFQIILVIEGKMPTLVGNEQLSIRFIPHRPHLFHIWTENVQVRFVGIDYESDYSCADTISFKQKIEGYPIFGKNK